jgi:ribosomal-protein-alanine N-acetyltransferase
MTTAVPVDFGIDRVTTARLTGRRPEAGDVATYARIFTDARVDEAAWPEHLRTADRAHALLDDLLRHWKRWGFGPWTVLLDGTPIGYAGLLHADVGGRPEVELLWFLDADHWGDGYGTEMAQEAVRVAFDVLELDAVVAQTVDVNRASRAVMEKLGMTYERDVVHAGLPHVLYRRSR